MCCSPSESGYLTGTQLRRKIRYDLDCDEKVVTRRLMHLLAECVHGAHGFSSYWCVHVNYQERIQRLKEGKKI